MRKPVKTGQRTARPADKTMASSVRRFRVNPNICMRNMPPMSEMGMATISHTQFAGDEWQIEGRDISGRYMEVDVDANTGEVLNVDR